MCEKAASMVNTHHEGEQASKQGRVRTYLGVDEDALALHEDLVHVGHHAARVAQLFGVAW